MVPSKNFQAFLERATADIWGQIGKGFLKEPYFTGPVRVHTDIFIRGRTRVDGDNLHTSLLDVLESAKVIDDDNNVIKGSYEKHSQAPAWGAVIVIENYEVFAKKPLPHSEENILFPVHSV